MEQSLERGKKYPDPDEAIDIDAIAEIEVRLQIKAAEMRKSQESSQQSQMQRGQHPKQHGCVWAEFIVEENLREELKIGIFKEPGKKFPTWIRFSNARKQDDSEGGAHGMAIKLMDVEGDKVLEEEKDARTQDFILIDHPVFFIRNIKDYVLFEQALEEAPKPIKFFLPELNPFKWHLSEFLILWTLGKKRIGSPLETTYWSTTPYQFGAMAVKYFVEPSDKLLPKAPLGKTPNYLREAMLARLTEAKDEVYFDFYIQVQTDAHKMPVEDATVEWKGAEVHKVATIKIPPQKFDSSQQMEFGENLSYTPWHSLPEHEPLGGLNRVRRTVYLQTSKLRQQENSVPHQEPTPQTFTPNLIG